MHTLLFCKIKVNSIELGYVGMLYTVWGHSLGFQYLFGLQRLIIVGAEHTGCPELG